MFCHALINSTIASSKLLHDNKLLHDISAINFGKAIIFNPKFDSSSRGKISHIVYSRGFWYPIFYNLAALNFMTLDELLNKMLLVDLISF